MVRAMLLLLSLILSPFADTLIVAYGAHNAEPFIIKKEEAITGIFSDIMKEVSDLTSIPFAFKEIPRKRLEEHLLKGKAHIYLKMNPLWVSQKELFDWSIPLFQENDVILLRSDDSLTIEKLDDLKGKNIGTILGFHYEILAPHFQNGTIKRTDAKSLKANFNKLELKRIDCLIDSEILISYRLKESGPYALQLAPFIASSHDVHGMLSKKAPLTVEKLNHAIEEIKNSGKLRAILEKYQ